MRPEHDELLLDPVPASVGRARRMVAVALREVDREDLVDSAELVISELVTNALLHAGAPITVRVRGTRCHPRVEVGDLSMRLPRLPDLPAPDAEALRVDPVPDPLPGSVLMLAPDGVDADIQQRLDQLTMGGRGIRLVITHSVSWGVDRTTGGKTVWFEPAADPRPEAPNEIQVFETVVPSPSLPAARRSLDGLGAAEHPDPAEGLYDVHLLNAPVRVLAGVRRHYDDLQREIRLIGLQYGRAASTLPRHLFEQAAHPELHRLRAIGTEQLTRAVLAGEEHADLAYRVAAADAAAFARTVALFLEADEFCRRERLLTLALSEQHRAALTWFVDQIVSQVAGRSPEAWDETADSGA